MPARTVQTLVSNMVGVVTDSLKEDNVVSLAQFGTFEVRKKMERVIVSPTTKKKMLVPPKLVVGFKPATMLKEKTK